MVSAVVADTGIGGAFLCWSLYYLNGAKSYYFPETDNIKVLPSNPLSSRNAHNFEPIKTTSAQRFNAYYHRLTKRVDTSFMYLHNFPWDNDGLTQSVKQLGADNNKFIVLAKSQRQRMYEVSIDSRSDNRPSGCIDNKTLYTQEEMFNDFIQNYFKESFDIWKKEYHLERTENFREFLSLNVPFDTEIQSILPNVFKAKADHFLLNANDMMSRLDISIYDIFKYLNLNIVDERFNNWQHIYTKWKAIHYQKLQFVDYFDQIIQYIIHGLSMDLTKFKLDILQESAIQRALLYEHNLGLKTFGIEKFENTKQLHNLLEPNTYHKLY